MRIIFVNRFFFPDISATSQMLTDLAFFIAGKGHDVTVITSRQLYQAADARLVASETVNGVKVIRVATTTFGRARLLGRAFDYLSFYLSAAIALWRCADPETIVVAKTDPPLISVPAALMCKLRGATLVNWLQDVFPEVAQALGVRALQGFNGRIASTLRNWSLRAAAMTVVLGERMHQVIAGLGIPSEKILTIANWADGSLVRPIARDTAGLRRKWGVEKNFVVCYSGNFGRGHEFQTMLDAAAQMQAAEGASPETVFLFIGGGAQRRFVEGSARQLGLRSLRLVEYQPRERLGESLAVGDVHLATLLPALEGLMVPSKFYGIAAAGRPTLFIGDPDGEIARILSRHDIGVTVRPGDAQGLVTALLDLKLNPERRLAMGARARKVFEADYDMPVAIARWESALNAARTLR
jgi:glycosyltransferase involved in cell wall biosynthesis